MTREGRWTTAVLATGPVSGVVADGPAALLSHGSAAEKEHVCKVLRATRARLIERTTIAASHDGPCVAAATRPAYRAA